MRHTRTTRALWIVAGVAWVTMYVAEGYHLTHAVAPWWVHMLRSPTVAAAAATLVLALVIWGRLTPLASVTEVMFAAGRRAGCAHGQGTGTRESGGAAVPMPHRPSSPSVLH